MAAVEGACQREEVVSCGWAVKFMAVAMLRYGENKPGKRQSLDSDEESRLFLLDGQWESAVQRESLQIGEMVIIR